MSLSHNNQEWTNISENVLYTDVKIVDLLVQLLRHQLISDSSPGNNVKFSDFVNANIGNLKVPEPTMIFERKIYKVHIYVRTTSSVLCSAITVFDTEARQKLVCTTFMHLKWRQKTNREIDIQFKMACDNCITIISTILIFCSLWRLK